jgi:hypothetical protein
VAQGGGVEPQADDPFPPPPRQGERGLDVSGCAQLTRKYSGDAVSSTMVIASASGVPLGNRPSVSTVNEIATGMPT